MSWTITLEDENKKVLEIIDEEFDCKILLSQTELKRFKLLKYLDPFGETVFNRLQKEDLINDLNELKRIDENAVVDNIFCLIRVWEIKPLTYLIFSGD